jgi:hypothetical protein
MSVTAPILRHARLTVLLFWAYLKQATRFKQHRLPKRGSVATPLCRRASEGGRNQDCAGTERGLFGRQRHEHGSTGTREIRNQQKNTDETREIISICQLCKS